MAAFVTARAYVASYASVVTMTERAMMRRSSRRSCVRDGVNPVAKAGEFDDEGSQMDHNDIPNPTKSNTADRPCGAPM